MKPSGPCSLSESLDRRRLLRWFGAALVLPTTLAACTNSTSRRYRRTSSDIRGMDHRDGAVGLKHVTNF
jgi:hypothetical protein